MTPEQARKEADAAAVNAAAETLRRGTAAAAVHFTGRPLFQRTIRLRGSHPLVYRIMPPGVAQVIDPIDGVVVAESLPGNLHQLRSDFVPGRTLE
ncbi:MAG TPA: hypothetical protein VM407_13225 [Acidovorax sp.]|nr:hypothetical protein [Acidovorax sp.]